MSGLTVADVLALVMATAIMGGALLVERPRFAARALAVLGTAVAAVLLVSAALALSPVDPARAILGDDAPPASIVVLRARLFLVDDSGAPIGAVARTARFLRGAAAAAVLGVAPARMTAALTEVLGDEPRAFRSGEPVRVVIAHRLLPTVVLGLTSTAVATVAALALALVAAGWRRRRPALVQHVERAVLAVAAMPRMVVGPALVLLFAVALRLVPPSGVGAGGLVLPVVTLALPFGALLFRTLHPELVRLLKSEAARAARARGIPGWRVLAVHLLREALVPACTLLFAHLGGVLAGAVVVEKMFAWPGVGLLLAESIAKNDAPVVQGIVVLGACASASATLVLDALLPMIDPRIAAHGQRPGAGSAP